MKTFDVSADGKQILFDRYRENADVVLIDLPRRETPGRRLLARDLSRLCSSA